MIVIPPWCKGDTGTATSLEALWSLWKTSWGLGRWWHLSCALGARVRFWMENGRRRTCPAHQAIHMTRLRRPTGVVPQVVPPGQIKDQQQQLCRAESAQFNLCTRKDSLVLTAKLKKSTWYLVLPNILWKHRKEISWQFNYLGPISSHQSKGLSLPILSLRIKYLPWSFFTWRPGCVSSMCFPQGKINALNNEKTK